MEEYRKENWLNTEKSPCYKCSNKGMCMIACGCDDWRKWYNNQNKK